jgi:hypothetical protein
MKTLTRTDLDGMTCSATFDDEEAYRYHLCWQWAEGPRLVAWMLNPSTATHEVLDRTISGLLTRARSWGLAGVEVVNLFGLRATDPKVMLAHPEPVGPDNDLVIRRVLNRAADEGSTVIAGWGADGTHLGRQKRALELAAAAGVALHALQVNAGGTPKHPLYIAHARRPVLWEPGDER